MGAPSPGGTAITEASNLGIMEAGMCQAGSVLNTFLSRHPRKEIKQPLIYLGGQILLLNCFLTWNPFPGGSVQMPMREVSSVPLESNRISLLFRPAKLCSVSGCSS